MIPENQQMTASWVYLVKKDTDEEWLLVLLFGHCKIEKSDQNTMGICEGKPYKAL